MEYRELLAKIDRLPPTSAIAAWNPNQAKFITCNRRFWQGVAGYLDNRERELLGYNSKSISLDSDESVRIETYGELFFNILRIFIEFRLYIKDFQQFSCPRELFFAGLREIAEGEIDDCLRREASRTLRLQDYRENHKILNKFYRGKIEDRETIELLGNLGIFSSAIAQIIERVPQKNLQKSPTWKEFVRSHRRFQRFLRGELTDAKPFIIQWWSGKATDSGTNKIVELYKS